MKSIVKVMLVLALFFASTFIESVHLAIEKS